MVGRDGFEFCKVIPEMDFDAKSQTMHRAGAGGVGGAAWSKMTRTSQRSNVPSSEGLPLVDGFEAWFDFC